MKSQHRNSKRHVKCFDCQEKAHIRRDCLKRRNQGDMQNVISNVANIFEKSTSDVEAISCANIDSSANE